MTHRGEDKPLLVSIMDTGRGRKGSDDETYASAKYGQSAMIKKWKYGVQNNPRGRARGIIQGAASVMDKWPENLTVCWLTGVAIFMIVVTCYFILESSFSRINPQSFTAHGIQKKCMAHHQSAFQNSPTQYPDKINVYLHLILNGKEKFETSKFSELFSSVVEHHPNHFLNVYVLYNDTTEIGYKRNARFKDWELYHNTFDAPKFFATSSAEDEHNNAAVNVRRNSPDVIDFENINIVRSSLSNYFHHSPLKNRWRLIPDSMIPFVLRVLSLWEHGGITMPWQLFKDKTDVYCVQKDTVGQLQDLMGAFQKKDLFAKETTTVRMTKEEIARELQSPIDLNENLGIAAINEGIVGETIEEVTKNEIQTKSPRKILPKKITQLIGHKKPEDPDYKDSKSEASVDDDDDDEDESSSTSSSSSSKSLPAHIKKIKNKLMLHAKKSEDLSSTDREIKKLLKDPKIQKKLKMVNVDNVIGQDNRLQRMKRDLQINRPDMNTLPPLNMDAVHQKSNISAKSVRKSPYSNYRFYHHSSRSGDYASSSEYSYSDYSSSSEDSYSGLNAPKLKITDLNKMKKILTSSETVDTLKGISSSTSSSSSSSSSSQDHFDEKKAYVHHKIFDAMNVFAMPHKSVVTTDKYGYYFSTKRPCHAYLGELISILQSSTELKDPDSVVDQALRVFCKGHKFNDCFGIHLI